MEKELPKEKLSDKTNPFGEPTQRLPTAKQAIVFKSENLGNPGLDSHHLIAYQPQNFSATCH
jgi:hypothetical protein